MKVRELIEILSKQDPEETIWILNPVARGTPLQRESVGKFFRMEGSYKEPEFVESFCILGD